VVGYARPQVAYSHNAINHLRRLLKLLSICWAQGRQIS
jgi:hypothetical protein